MRVCQIRTSFFRALTQQEYSHSWSVTDGLLLQVCSQLGQNELIKQLFKRMTACFQPSFAFLPTLMQFRELYKSYSTLLSFWEPCNQVTQPPCACFHLCWFLFAALTVLICLNHQNWAVMSVCAGLLTTSQSYFGVSLITWYISLLM